MPSFYIKFIGPLMFIVLMATNLQASKFLEGSIYLKNGASKQGYVKSFSYSQKQIKFRSLRTSKTEIVNVSDIRMISLVLKDDTLSFVNFPLAKFKKKQTEAISISTTCWAVEVYSSDKIKAYQYFHDPFQFGIMIVAGIPIPVWSEDNDIYYAVQFPDANVLYKLEKTRKQFGEVTSYKINKVARNILAMHCPSIVELVDVKSQNRLLSDLLDKYSTHCN